MADNKMQIVITALDETQRAFANLQSSLKQVQGELGQLGGASRGATTQVNGLGSAFGMLQTAMAAVGMGAFITQLHQAGVAAEKLRNSFEVITGTATAGANAMAFVRGESNRLGLDLQSTASAFSKLSASAKGTSLEGQKTQMIFTSIAGAGRALNLSADEMSGALTAVSQMISKGTVQSEELRGQLSERLPGAFQIAARAMGVSASELGKMLEQGKVVSEDFLPKFAAELQKTFPAGEKAISGMTAETERLKTAWFDLKAQVMQSGGETVFTAALRMLKKDLESVKGLFSSIDELYQLIRHPLTRRPSTSKGEPISAFDAAVMGIGETPSYTGTNDFRFRAGTPPPSSIQPKISANSSIVKDPSLVTDEQKKELKKDKKGGSSVTDFNTFVSSFNSLQVQSEENPLVRAFLEIDTKYSDLLQKYSFLNAKDKAAAGKEGINPEKIESMRLDAKNIALDKYFKGQAKDQADSERSVIEANRHEQQEKRTAIDLEKARLLSEIETQEAQGAITAIQAQKQKLEVLQQIVELEDKRLADLPRATVEESIAWNQQAQKVEGVKKQVADLQKSLRLREGWDGLKQGLEEYASAATNLGQQIQAAVQGTFKGMEDAMVNFVKTGKLNFSDLANSIINDMVRIMIQQSITGPLANAFGGMIGGFFGGSAPASVSGAGGSLGSSMGAMFAAKGMAFDGGVRKFATGGLVVTPTFFGTSSGLGLMGEEGPEAIMPLARTGSGHLGVRMAGGGQQELNVSVNVINQTSQPVSAKTGGMQFDGKQFVISTIIENVQNNGPLRGLMAGGGAY